MIRLRGLWEYQPLARIVQLPDGARGETTEALPPPGRLPLLADWNRMLGGDFRGRVLLTRHFGQPTGLAPGDRMDLVFTGIAAHGTATLNGAPLGTLLAGPAAIRFDVTVRLRRRNELVVVLELLPDSDSSPASSDAAGQEAPAGPLGEVRLEIVVSAHP